MPAAVLILHAYSADNAGDGLLVDEAVGIAREAVGVDAAITVLAGYPESFDYLDVARVVSSKPSRRGWSAEYLSILRSIDTFDLVIGVGGGYLRSGHALEAVKMLLSHGPQLWRAAAAAPFTVYLPQSVGPLRFGTRRLIEKLMSQLDLVMYRDDTSMRELPAAGAVRRADLAAVGIGHGRGRPLAADDAVPVLSVRSVRGAVPSGIAPLAGILGTFDGYTQSTVSGNDDTEAMATLGYRRMVPRPELMTPGATPRVVIAMRLHAALMALEVGHYVIHLAYERKGYGAFGDLALPGFVHDSKSFDPNAVATQARELLSDPTARRRYDDAISASMPGRLAQHDELVARIAAGVGVRA